MSRFADPTSTDVISLGACECPGTPHEADEAVVRYELGASALVRVGAAELSAARGDPYAGWRQLVIEATVSWNLLDADGAEAPLTLASVAELNHETLTTLAKGIDDLIQAQGALPNASGAPSPASPRGSASPTRTPARKRGT